MKKEKYFTKDNIDIEGKKLLSQFERRRLPKSIDGKMALLVLDMQDYFLNPESHAYVPSSDAIVGNILKVNHAFGNKQWPVYCTQHINAKGDAGMMESWWRDLLTKDHPDNILIKEISKLDHPQIQKSQYDAFYKTDLLDRIKEDEITDVVISGVMTHLCCETTARAAFVNGFRVWFLIDGNATYNLDFHMNTIKNLNHGFAYTVLTDELIKLVGK